MLVNASIAKTPSLGHHVIMVGVVSMKDELAKVAV